MLFSHALRLVFEAMLLFRNLGCARLSKSHYKNICDSVDLKVSVLTVLCITFTTC